MGFSLPKQDAPVGEHSQRIQRLRHEMEPRRIDVVVLTDQANIEYFLGYHTLTWAYKARPLFAVITADDQTLIAARTEVRNVDHAAGGFRTAYYAGYLTDACREVSEVIGSQNTTPQVIAVDYGQDFFGRGSLELIDALTLASDSKPPISAGSAIWAVRKIKSPFEVAQKRTAFSIVNRAFDRVVAAATTGITEREMHNRLQAVCFEHGAETADPIAMTFGRGELIYNRPPGKRKLQDGDYVWTDFRATFGGYPADRNRIARAGAPPAWEREVYSRVREVTIELAKSVRPSETTGAVFTRYLNMWKESGLPETYKYLNRIGHGGGLDVTEPPSVSRGGDEVLEAGMILHFEPKLELDGAVFQFEEVVHLRGDGVEFISALSPETIPVIQVASVKTHAAG